MNENNSDQWFREEIGRLDQVPPPVPWGRAPAWEKIEQRMAPPPVKKIGWLRYAFAAAACVLLVLEGLFLHFDGWQANHSPVMATTPAVLPAAPISAPVRPETAVAEAVPKPAVSDQQPEAPESLPIRRLTVIERDSAGKLPVSDPAAVSQPVLPEMLTQTPPAADSQQVSPTVAAASDVPPRAPVMRFAEKEASYTLVNEEPNSRTQLKLKLGNVRRWEKKQSDAPRVAGISTRF